MIVSLSMFLGTKLTVDFSSMRTGWREHFTTIRNCLSSDENLPFVDEMFSRRNIHTQTLPQTKVK